MNLDNLIVAHRGIHNKFIPENSMLAFRKCLEKKYPIELDIRILKDNSIVVFHDANLYRMTGLNKKIENCTYDEIKDLKLNHTTENIPLLIDVLELINDEVLIMIELKSKKKNFLSEVLKILNNYSNYVIQSFDIKQLSKIKRINPNVKVGLITMGRKNKYVFLNFIDFFVHSLYGDNKLLNNYKPIFIWGIKSKDDLKKAKKYGNNFIVDYL